LRDKILHPDEFESKCLISPKKDTMLHKNTLQGENLLNFEIAEKTDLGATILIL